MNKRKVEPVEEAEEAPLTEPVEVPEAPPGLPWEKLITLSVTPEKLAEQLRANNLLTYQDLVKNPMAVIGVLQSAYGLDYARLQQVAKEYEDANKRD